MRTLTNELDFDMELDELYNAIDSPKADMGKINAKIKLLNTKMSKVKAAILVAQMTGVRTNNWFFDTGKGIGDASEIKPKAKA